MIHCINIQYTKKNIVDGSIKPKQSDSLILFESPLNLTTGDVKKLIIERAKNRTKDFMNVIFLQEIDDNMILYEFEKIYEHKYIWCIEIEYWPGYDSPFED